MFSPKAAFVTAFSLAAYLVDAEDAETEWSDFVEVAKALDTDDVIALATIVVNSRGKAKSLELVDNLRESNEDLESYLDPGLPERNRKYSLCLLLGLIERGVHYVGGALAATLLALKGNQIGDQRISRALAGMLEYTTEGALERRQRFRKWIHDGLEIALAPTGKQALDVPDFSGKADKWLEEMASVRNVMTVSETENVTLPLRALARMEALARATNILPVLPDFAKLIFEWNDNGGELSIPEGLKREVLSSPVAPFAEILTADRSIKYDNGSALASLLQKGYLELISSRIAAGELV
jgi:hypothetical protein